MKRQFFTLDILIYIILYSCSAVSSKKYIVCRKGDNYITENYRLSPWKTVEFKAYFKNGYLPLIGSASMSYSRSVTPPILGAL